MKLAERLKFFDASGIRKVFDLARTMTNPVNLSIGQPDFDIPEIFKKEAKKAIDQGFNSYTPTQGLQETIDLVNNLVYQSKGYKPPDTIITSGVSGGILLSYLALLDPGDEIIIPDPYFVMYKHLARLTGSKPVFLDTYPDFCIKKSALLPLINSKTRCIVINSPNNPTGNVLSEEDIALVVETAKRHNLVIISDEIYDYFLYDRKSLPSPWGKYENVVLLNGFSKAFSMTGWRIGYACGPKDLINEMKKLQQYTFVCAPSFAQKSLSVIAEADMSVYRNSYREKRDMIWLGLKDKYSLQKPGGAFYAFPRSPYDTDKFIAAALKEQMLIIPGNVFSEKNTHFRIAFAQSDETIRRGLEIFNKIAGENR
ncbi:MAG TPA: aspartate aminotransferase [Spirochaetia bacterium]|nr:aspartate aminotransferase [Spirochaetia bacterium]